MKPVLMLVIFLAGLWPILVMAAGPTWQDLIDRAEALAASGKPDSAGVFLTQALSLALTQYAESDSTVKIYLYKTGLRQGYGFTSFEEAESLFAQGLRVKEGISGQDDLETAQILNDLACVYIHQKRNNEARPLLERAIALRERLLGAGHPDTAISVGLLGYCCHYGAPPDYEQAERLLTRALTDLEAALGPDHETVARFAYFLGQLNSYQGKLPAARRLLEQAARIMERVYGPDSPEVAIYINRLAWAHYNQGTAEAESLHKRAMAIWEKAYGPDAVQVSWALAALGSIYVGQGRYAEAEVALRRALAIKEKVSGPDDFDAAGCRNALACIRMDQGIYDEAERLLLQALTIGEKVYGPDHDYVAVGQHNLGILYRIQGRYAEAEPLLKHAIDVWESSFGENNMDVGGGCIELGLLYRAQARYAEAETLFLRSVAIADGAFGTGSGDAARALQGLGDVYLDRGQFAQAEAAFGTVLGVRDWGPDATDPNLPETLESMTRLHRYRGESDEALAMARRALDLRTESFVGNAYALSEKDALAYSQALRSALSTYLTCQWDLGPPGQADAAGLADAALSGKGLVSDGIFERRQGIVEETDEATLALAESLRLAKFQLSQLFVKGPGEDREAYRARVDSLSGFTNDLEADLSSRSASYRRQQDYRRVTAARLAALLPGDASLVEYIRYDHKEINPERSVPHYLAVVVRGNGEPVVSELGDAAPIDGLIEAWRDHMLRVASSGKMPTIIEQQEYDRLSRDIYDKVWKPVEAYTDGRDVVLVAPDGALNMLAFGGLEAPDGKYLIEKHALHHLSAGRDLARLEYRPEPALGLLALGDPDYGASAATRLAAASLPQDSTIQVAFATRNVRSGCGELSELEVRPLPGTRREVELVSQIWETSTPEPVVACYGDEASEERFKAEAPGKRVIHLATHGYFLGGACQPEAEDGTSGPSVGRIGENPLLLSGLLFAGANLHGEGADSAAAEDGILTAYEVSALDLEGTELVVLSACETGLGEVAEGEGVYGLRRAFQMAGARTVVSALWPVSDEATARMMGQLYSRADETLPDALRRVQLEALSELRAQGKVDHPFTWGAFIALGDWR